MKKEIERLKTQLAQANAGIVNCSGCKIVEINAVREFAEKLKERLNLGLYEWQYAKVDVKIINELLKEYEK